MGLFGIGKKKKLNPQQIEQVRRRIKIMADSLKIIQETENLETFFSRYKLAEDTINEIGLIAGYDTPCIANETPQDCLDSLLDSKQAQTNCCLERYIRKETLHILNLTRGRKAKAKAIAAIIEEYAPQMTEQNIELGRRLAKKLMEKVEKLEEA